MAVQTQNTWTWVARGCSAIVRVSLKKKKWHSLWLFQDLLQIKSRNLTRDQFNLKVEALINRKVRLLLKTFGPACRINKLSGGDLRAQKWSMGGGGSEENLVELFEIKYSRKSSTSPLISNHET